MATTMIPVSEIELLARAFELSPLEAGDRLSKLSEMERNVVELRAPYAGDVLPEREVARRLGLSRRELRRIRGIAEAKLRHPAYG